MQASINPTWAWTALALALLVIEGSLAGSFVAAFFAVGALAAALGTATGTLPLPWQQSVVFAVASTASLMAARRPLLAWAQKMAKKTPLEADRGATAKVLSEMAPGAIGEAMLHGTLWAARNVGATPLAPGALVIVRDVEGLSLQVAAAPPPAAATEPTATGKQPEGRVAGAAEPTLEGRGAKYADK